MLRELGNGGSTQPSFKRDDIQTLSYANCEDLIVIGNLIAENNLSTSHSIQPINPDLLDNNNHKELIRNNNVEVVEGSGSKAAAVEEVNKNENALAERERRRIMKSQFTELLSLIPDISSKADQCTIMDETVKHIKSLEQTLETLKRKKEEKRKAIEAKNASFIGNSPHMTPMPRISNGFTSWNWDNNIKLNVSGEEAYISICTPKKSGLMTIIAFVLQNHHIEVVSAQLSSNHVNCMYNIHAHYSTPGAFDQSSSTLMVEEAFKKAIDEITLYMNQL